MAKHFAEQFEMPFAALTIQVFESRIIKRPVAHIHLRGKKHAECGWPGHLKAYFRKPFQEVEGGFTICKTCAKIARKKKIAI